MRRLTARLRNRLAPRTAADNSLPDVSAEIQATLTRCQPYSMTSAERLVALCNAIEYTVRNAIPGAFVECGVWRGGSSMAAALTYLRLERSDTDLYLYDTFEGMSEPSARDVEANSGVAAAELLARAGKDELIWCYSPIDEVRRNIESTRYPADRIHLIKGKVEESIPHIAPDTISILRLDTDWYESTRHELVHLFPRLASGGVLIIDDYGHWSGARRAVDDYIAEHGLRILLNRIDYTGRIAVKC